MSTGIFLTKGILGTLNNRTIREVTQASNLPPVLEANTTYLIRGEVTITTPIVCNVEGVELVGLDRNLDHIIWDGTGALLTVSDVNFGISGARS